MTTTTFTFDGTSSTTIPELLVTRVRRPLVPSRRDEYVDVPGHEGFWLFTEKAGPRTITVDFDLHAADFASRRAAVISLADMLDAPSGLAHLIFSDEPDRFHNARLSSSPDPDEWLTRSTFSVDFTAEPYSYAITPSTDSRAATSAVPSTLTIADKVPAYPIVTLTANGGTVVGYSLQVGNMTLVDTATIASAGKRTISSLSYTVVTGDNTDTDLEGTFNGALLDMSGVSGDFPILEPGANTILVTKTAGTATTITVAITWRRRSR